MKIRKVTIKNLNSLRLTTTIHFDESPLRDTGLFAITGDTGAGKTTILDAITLSLYGQIHRNKEVQEVMSYGATESLAEVEFDNGEDRYRAKWTIWRAHNKVDGNIQPPRREVSQWNPEKEQFEIIAEKVREADQVIEMVTGLDYDRFTRSVLLAQGDFAAFLQAGEKDRSDLLERITGTAVYTQLSQGAYQRHKLELEKLQELQRRQEALQLLSGEEVEDLKAQLKTQQEQIKKKRRSLEETRKDLQWVTRRRELEQQRKAILEQQQSIEREKEKMTDDLQRLTRYQQVRPFEGRLHRADDLSQTINELEIEKEDLLEKRRIVEESLEEAARKKQERQKSLIDTRSQLDRRRPLFEEIIQLDISIKEKEGPLGKSRRSLGDLREKRKKQLTEKQQKEQEKEKRQAQLEEHQKWLDNHPALEGLQADLSGMEQLANRWQGKREEANRLLTSQQKVEKELSAQQKMVHQVEKKMRGLQEKHQQWEAAFHDVAPDNYTASRSELLEVMGGELDQLRTRGQQLERLVQLSDEYRSLLQQQDDCETELEDLMGQELTLNKSLMTAMERMETLDREMEYRQEIYRQQQLIANYEKDRGRLQEGEPCPLCLSRDHPFRREAVQPFVDKSRQELDRVSEEKKEAHRRYQGLLKQQSEITSRLEQLIGDGERRKGRRHELQERLEILEERILESAPLLGDDLLRIGRVELLRDKLEEAQQLMDLHREKRSRLQEIHQKLENADQQLRRFQEKYASGNTELKVLEQKNTNLREQVSERRQEAEAARQALHQRLKQYGKNTEDALPQELIERLRGQNDEFLKRRETLAQTKQELRLLEQQIQQLNQNLHQSEETIGAAAEELAAAEEELDRLRAYRREHFEERDPKKERKKLEQQLSEKTDQLEAAQKNLADIQLDQQRLVALLKQKEVDIHKNHKRLTELKENLKVELTAAGIDSLTEARSALLSAQEVQQLQQRRKALERREVETEKALSDKSAELKTHLQKERTNLTEESLNAQVQQLEEALGNLQQAGGAIRERLENNSQREKEARALIEQIQGQRAEYNRWAKLNDIIGSADGKKFRVFAQGLTLSRLVRLANEHLQNLNGRYIIRKRYREDLGLEIIDTFQADNVRSMNTLSGGESFLVSLSLALGLSDLAGQQTNIRSLFIDEGFGTLDENSLDLAISTLENLQAGGKVIGVISHVKELKERISVQIKVKKSGNGFSNLEIVG